MQLINNRINKEDTLKSAVDNELQSNITIHKDSSNVIYIPWSTLEDNLRRAQEDHVEQVDQLPKVGRPFSLTVDITEQQVVAYIKEMQELGFRVTANQIRDVTLSLAKTNNTINLGQIKADWSCWWASFKQRYGSSLRLSENSTNRVRFGRLELARFYEKLEKTLVDYDMLELPDRIWNCDWTCLLYTNQLGKIKSSVGKTYVYNSMSDEKGFTAAVLSCINAAGLFLPPMVVFKGDENIPELSDDCISDSLTRFSSKGLITADLFLEWLKFFTENIPPARPVLLIMDSYTSYVSPEILDYATSNEILLFTTPSHTLQPLNVGVIQPLRAVWHEQLQQFRANHQNVKLSKFHFHKLLALVYERCFNPTNIRSGFEATGIYPLNKSRMVCW